MKEIDKNRIREFLKDAKIESEDVMLWNNYIFVGKGDIELIKKN